MIPLRVYLKGFLSYKEEQMLLFDGASLWVLAGPNGAGKSAVFDAITYALYGFHRGGGQGDVDLINHQCDSFVVEFDFLIEGAAYRVRRTVSRRGRKTRQVLRLQLIDEHERVESVPDTDSDAGLRRWVEKTIGLDYAAFTSSVLLLQGKSERLIEADPNGRYKTLTQIIDLSPYQRLHQAVDEARKEYAQQIKVLDAQLSKTLTVTDAELAAAAEAVAAAEEEHQQARTTVDRLAELVGYARQWETLTVDLSGRQEELEHAQSLLDRADEIRNGFDRWHELGDVLPDVEDVIRQSKRLADLSGRIATLELEVQRLEDELAEDEKDQQKAGAEAERLGQEVEQLQQEDTALAKRLLELAPVVMTLQQLESAEEELAKLDKKLGKLPDGLGQRVEEAEDRDRQLEAAARAKPWLKELADDRAAIAEALKRAQEAQTNQEAADAEAERERSRRDRLAGDVEEAERTENRLAHGVTVARTRREEAIGRRDRFAEAATQPKCSLCGQAITKEHAVEEQARLETVVTSAGAELERVKQLHEVATERLQGLSSDLANLNTRLAELADDSTRASRALGQAERDARVAVAAAVRAYGSLPESYRSKVAPESPLDANGWLATVYPSEDDLAEVRQEADSRPSHQKRLGELRKQHGEWQRLDGQRKGTAERVAELKAKCQVEEAKKAREESGRLEKRQEELGTQLEDRRTAHGDALAAVEVAKQATKDTRGQLEDCKTQLTTAQATCNEVERSRESQLAVLPQSWRAPAESAGESELAAWEAERDELAHYEGEAAELRGARQSVDDLTVEIGKLRERIGQVPEKARRSAKEVEAELGTAKEDRDRADDRRKEAQGKQSQLEEQRRQRAELEETRRTADRQRHVHELLANLLGPNGLQHQLLRRAEGDIVRLANEVLDGLSRGRMRLELRSGADSSKALDLVVYNLDTGSKPIAVALASGSQRFRIAVSLALAVGRYAGMEARRIESVIIDEGFGSLDKAGRDDMIQQLNDLREQLARVILVSHQEEFAGAFVNGYRVELVDGASCVSLLEQA